MNIDKIFSPWHLVWLMPVSYAADVYFGQASKPNPLDDVPNNQLPHQILISATVIEVGYAAFSQLIKQLLKTRALPADSLSAESTVTVPIELMPAAAFSLTLDYQCGIHPVVGCIGFAKWIIILHALPVTTIFCPNLGYRILITATEVCAKEMFIRFSRKRYPKWF